MSALDNSSNSSFNQQLLDEKYKDEESQVRTAASKKDSEEKPIPEDVKVLLVLAFFSPMFYFQVAPFFPKFCDRKGIDKAWVGFVMSANAASFLVAAMLTGKYLLKCMRRINCAFLGSIFIIVSLIGYGLLDLLDDPQVIISLAILFQVTGGFGTGMVLPSSMAIMSCYSDRRQEFIGYFEMMGGLAVICAPIFGVSFYLIFGFMGPFECTSALFALSLFYFLKCKNSTSFSFEKESDIDQSEDESSNLKVLTFFDIIRIPRSAFGLAVQFVCYFAISFNTPLFTTHLDSLGFSPSFVGLILVLLAISYGAMISMVDCVTEKYSKRGAICFGLIIQNIGINITGWDNCGNWQLTMWFSIIGMILFGFGSAMVTIPIMPEILEAIEEHPNLNGMFDVEQMHNNVSGYFIVCQAIGEILGPLSSSFLKLQFRFRPAQQFLGLFVTTFLIFYIMICGMDTFFNDNKRKQHNEVDKKEEASTTTDGHNYSSIYG